MFLETIELIKMNEEVIKSRFMLIAIMEKLDLDPDEICKRGEEIYHELLKNKNLKEEDDKDNESMDRQ